MKKLILCCIVGSITLLTSCGGSESSSSEKTNQNKEPDTTLDSSLDFAITEKYQTLDPIKITDVTSFHIASQIYEPLLRFDEKDLTLKPLLAESWSVSEDNLVYTFNLKKGVFFQDNECFSEGKGRELKAADVVYTFERIFSIKDDNYTYGFFKNTIKGGEKFRTSGGEISGIKAVDDYTVSFTLTNPSSNFISLMAVVTSSIVAKEAIEKNKAVGTGPFTYNKTNDTESAITLLKNQNYHVIDKNNVTLPYLESVTYNYVQKGQDELSLFKDGKLDVIIGIPPESVKEIVESQIADFQNKPSKYILGRYPKVLTSFLTLNNTVEPFNNIKVRQAIGMAINKTKIVDNILKGEAFGPGNHGIVPPAIKNYDFSSVIGQEYNIAKAKKLLTNAGYPNGEGLPTIKFASGKGNVTLRVSLEIQKQLLANLNINVEMSSLSKKEILELHSSSQINMSLSGWLGEFPDPISFLSLFYGANVPNSNQESSYPNESRYKNAQFDKLYEKAIVTIDTKKRYELCLEADQIIATEVPVIPLWYQENYHLIQASVKNYQPNPMSIQYLVHVKIEEPVSNKKE